MTADPAPSRPGPERLAPPRAMHDLGAALGTSVWWCEQLFTVTGEWVPETPEASVRLHLAELSRVLGDHASAVRRHLPRPAGVEPQSWVTAPGPGATAALKALAVEGSTASRLAGLHRAVVPRLLVAWDSHVRRPSLSDRGVARTLRHAQSDLLELWHEGEDLLQGLITTEPASPEEVGRAVSHIEGHLATIRR